MQPKQIWMYKRILIVGDSGRGKSTFAKILSEKLKIPFYSTDDYFWKLKYTVPNDREQSVIEINKLYEQGNWIVEGSTRRLILNGLEKSDIIFYLKFRNILFQHLSIIKRNLLAKDEKFSDLYRLLKHTTYKKYKKGYGAHLPPLDELIVPHMDKTKVLHSYKEINKFLDSI